jgi:hypothetical protein
MDKLKKEKFTADITAYVMELLNARVENAYDVDHVWQTHFMDCIENVEFDISRAEEDIVELKEDKLTLNALEQEGYLRGLKTTLNTLKRFMPQEGESE